MIKVHGQWEVIGPAETWLEAVLPPRKFLVRNIATGEYRIVLVGMDQEIGDAIAKGQWVQEADSRSPEPTPPRPPRDRGSHDRNQRSGTRKRGSRRARSTESSGRGAGGGHLGYHPVYGAIAAAVSLTSGSIAQWAYHRDLIVLWAIFGLLFLLTAVWALQFLSMAILVVGALWALVSIPSCVIERIQKSKAQEEQRIAAASEERRLRTTARSAASTTTFIVPASSATLPAGFEEYALGRLTKDDMVVVDPLEPGHAHVALTLDKTTFTQPRAIRDIGRHLRPPPFGFHMESSSLVMVDKLVMYRVDELPVGRWARPGRALEAFVQLEVPHPAYRISVHCAVGAPNPRCDHR